MTTYLYQSSKTIYHVKRRKSTTTYRKRQQIYEISRKTCFRPLEGQKALQPSFIAHHHRSPLPPFHPPLPPPPPRPPPLPPHSLLPIIIMFVVILAMAIAIGVIMTIVLFLVLILLAVVFFGLLSVLSPASITSFFSLLPPSLGLFPAFSQSRAPRQGSAMNSGCASAL